MIQHSRDFVECGIPHLFDPGQGLILFNGEQLRNFIREARWVVTNDYEYEVLRERTGLDAQAIAEQVDALIVTRGAEGSDVITVDGTTHIEPTGAERVEDPRTTPPAWTKSSNGFSRRTVTGSRAQASGATVVGIEDAFRVRTNRKRIRRYRFRRCLVRMAWGRPRG